MPLSRAKIQSLQDIDFYLNLSFYFVIIFLREKGRRGEGEGRVLFFREVIYLA